MTVINWAEEVEKRKDDIIKETQGLLRIKSVFDESSISENAPFGEGILKALNFLLRKGEEGQFITKNVDGYAGYMEFGQGEESIGILCHLDVVPEGNDWSYDPYGAIIEDGKIFARGAIDDKGPTMAAFFAMKIVKELGLPISKRVRMILGCDEESSWKCVEHYFQHEEMPTMGFAPDADFPIIYAEKGIADFRYTFKNNEKNDTNALELVSFQSGLRRNMVPDQAVATIKLNVEKEMIEESFEKYLEVKELKGSYSYRDNLVTLEVKGVSAHGMEPNNGRNAGLFLVDYLTQLELDPNAVTYMKWLHQYVVGDSRGNKLGIAYSDEITGPLTVNVGVLRYSREEGVGHVDLNVRYPVTQIFEEIHETLQSLTRDPNIDLQVLDHSKPHHVEKDHPLIKTLQAVYEKQTGDKAELLSIGGGTYARSLSAGVAFGPLFPGREDIAHQKDEYIYIEDLLRATAIYAEAIYELAK